MTCYMCAGTGIELPEQGVTSGGRPCRSCGAYARNSRAEIAMLRALLSEAKSALDPFDDKLLELRISRALSQ